MKTIFSLLYKVFSLFLLFHIFHSANFAESKSNFAHPLQIEPVAIYNKIRVNASYWDKRNLGIYEQNKNLNIEGEYNFWNNFSITSSIGKTNYVQTNSAVEETWNRWNFGLKYGKIFDFASGQLLVGGGISFFDRKRGGELRERENPEYYLIRPNFGLGFKSGRFEIMSELRFQTETNQKMKEGTLEEFRRYYQFGIAPSFAATESIRMFLELEYREPFDRNVDTKTRFFNIYPGIAYKSESIGTFSLSLQLSILARNENAMDRGIRFSYFYFFDTINDSKP